MSLVANSRYKLAHDPPPLVRSRRASSAGAPTWADAARPEQLPPGGDWLIWYIQAGRGWGKTRTGAEATWEASKRSARIAIVAETFSEGRDVCVEGETGIRTLHPELKWNRSIGEMTFPSGAKGKIYSAEDPDSLRGPNNYFAWCFVAETPVLMADGTQKRIADVRVGEYVQTRIGARRVTASSMTRRNAQVYLLHTVDGRDIIGTGDHPVWVIGKGFTPMSLISKGDSVCVTHVSNSRAKRGTSERGRVTTTSPLFHSTARFGKPRMGQFQKGITFIISMMISMIIVLKTWSCFLTLNTVSTTQKRTWGRIGKRRYRHHRRQWRVIERPAWRLRAPVPSVDASTTAVRLTPFVTVHPHVSSKPDRVHSRGKSGSVISAGLSTLHRSVFSATAHASAMIVHFGHAIAHCWYVIWIAPNVARRSHRSAQTPDSVPAHVPLLTTAEINTVERLATRYDVYDIAVEEAHEFFANGILVHNCDEIAKWRYLKQTWDQLMFTLRKGDVRCVITTTPRPMPFLNEIKARATTHLTRGTTYDNLANLAPAYIENVIRPYEGTEQGRQELNAEDLEDIEGALWKRAWIEQRRVYRMPDLLRVVTAIDPSATATGDEAGVVTAGIGLCDCGGAFERHGFMLSDDSVQASPERWAANSVAAYHKFKADKLIAEDNNGGEMVETTIRTIPGAPPVKRIHASRGKYTRAEPIAMLAQQGKIHHVGAFAKLEDELCSWTPGMESPNRLDAYVWAFTDLMLGLSNSAVGAFAR